MEEVYQVITKLVDGKTRLLSFASPSISVLSIKNRIQQITSIPIHEQRLLSDGRQLQDETLVSTNGSTIHLLLRLRGGKGGFGSLLRGAATKAGQKKTNNFDACRDMSGRRLRHVNAEKKMEEWRAEEGERNLEKIAEDYIKKKSKEAKKDGGAADVTAKYVAKYRKVSAKCVEDVEKAVMESFGGSAKNSKRKKEVASGSQSKRLKIWMGKRKVDDSDSDDSDSDDEASDKIEKSAVISDESNCDTNKGEDGSSESVTDGKLKELPVLGPVQGPTFRSSEEEKLIPLVEKSDPPQIPKDSSLNDEAVDLSEPLLKFAEESSIKNKADGSSDEEVNGNLEVKTVVVEEAVAETQKPLCFDEYNTAFEMEVLGLERLKMELQARGLKCGGTIAQRAARLFLLKTTPVEKLPKGLFAKK
jgi:hypothetical protein